eukprot:140449-Chlamydomonas_euryale.AAC.15
MEATFLKSGAPIPQWLLQVIGFAWESGIAPVECKSAVIVPLYKDKAAQRRSGSRRTRGSASFLLLVCGPFIAPHC